MQCAESIDIHTYETLSSGLREASYWPKNGFRSNLIALKFQKHFGGACNQTDLAVVCLCMHYKTPNLMAIALIYVLYFKYERRTDQLLANEIFPVGN